ncbi:division/cell wall cluster transcriptional repressor MraZ [Chachezhania antarctica]|uniref:division/cell wall cluster transcriptional repressor MraZ n=1 Tax=Chachezhania antarctica TaxID=2340860 RepID=UPI000EB39222|nr:division/cell wall cluster transcriptional repressor MraZ [Chachezhania antarctica]
MSRRFRFRGESHHKVDSKGRVSIPASFRRVLEEGDPEYQAVKAEGDDAALPNPEIVIVYGDHRRKYLQCYTMKGIEEVDAKIEKLPIGQERKFLERLYNGQIHTTSVDDTGRLVLPAKLRQKIGLTDTAFFIGAGTTFEIWNPETYEAEEVSKIEDWLDDQPDSFDPRELLNAVGED